MRRHNLTISRIHRPLYQETSSVQSEFAQGQMIPVLVLIFSDSKKYHREEVSCKSKTTTHFQHYDNSITMYFYLQTNLFNEVTEQSLFEDIPPEEFHQISLVTKLFQCYL